MIPVIRPEWPAAPSGSPVGTAVGTPFGALIGAVSTLRNGGASRGSWGGADGIGGLNLGSHVGDVDEDVRENRRRLRELLPAEPAWLTQVHGNTVVDAAVAADAAAAPEADASFTTQPGVVCAILTADCMPVLLADTQGRVVGAAHAGWRGLAGGVLEKTVAAMRAAGAGEILGWLGPAIGPSRFEVGADVRSTFVDSDPACAAAFVAIPDRAGKYLADLYALGRRRLALQGVTQVGGGNRCTVTEVASFYSYRRDGVTGRMATLIWIN